LDGTPVVLPELGVNVSVAVAPPVLLSTSVPPANIVPAEFVVYVMVVALALATIIKSTTAVMLAAFTKRFIVIFSFLLYPP
jgi:hypothetical protein